MSAPASEARPAAVSGEVAARMAAVVGERHCISDPSELRTYECDGLTSFRVAPGLVVLPGSTEEVAAVVRIARESDLPIVPRGAGTGLSGGALPVPGCIVIGLSRMRRILEVDLENGWMRVQPGVANLDVSKAIGPGGIGRTDRRAAEAAKAAPGLDWPDVGAARLMDVDGPEAEVEHTADNAVELARAAGALEIRRPRDEAERALMWKGRKSAFAAVGRISRNYIVQDGVIPRSEI